MNPKTKKIQLTTKGVQELQQELDELKNTKRPALVARLSNARDQGDLSENSDYLGAKEELEFMDDRIAELEQVLASAQLVSDSSSKDSVGIGNTVTVKLKGKAKEFTYHIVGDWEADPMKKKISIASPIGQALSQQKVGDVVKVAAPAGEIQYEIVSIN